jgi:hypothetical protein
MKVGDLLRVKRSGVLLWKDLTANLVHDIREGHVLLLLGGEETGVSLHVLSPQYGVGLVSSLYVEVIARKTQKDKE